MFDPYSMAMQFGGQFLNAGLGSLFGGKKKQQTAENAVPPDAKQETPSISQGLGSAVGGGVKNLVGSLSSGLASGVTDKATNSLFGKSPSKQGQDFRKFQENAFPNTNPWERLGSTGIPSAGVSPLDIEREKRKTAVQVAKIQAKSADNVATKQTAPRYPSEIGNDITNWLEGATDVPASVWKYLIAAVGFAAAARMLGFPHLVKKVGGAFKGKGPPVRPNSGGGGPNKPASPPRSPNQAKPGTHTRPPSSTFPRAEQNKLGREIGVRKDYGGSFNRGSATGKPWESPYKGRFTDNTQSRVLHRGRSTHFSTDANPQPRPLTFKEVDKALKEGKITKRQAQSARRRIAARNLSRINFHGRFRP